uniref:Rho GTPase-activating protein n=1 Tax=Mesocestoides corti TaxID=53468 RepID=A0A5K3FE37_MESCO
MSFPSGSYHSDADVIPTYTVCIIGDPQSGKSCFCNRFVYSHPDWYQEGHPSVLSEADFSGPVVNFDHWLYWGTVTRRLDDEASVRFCVIEQTEFLSDATSLPFRSPKKLSLSSNASSIHLNNVATASGVASPTNVTPFPLKELHSSNRLHDYILRSTAINLYSPGKLRYYSFEKLGQEQHCQQESFHNPGPLEVHGFLVIYDVSRRASCHDLPDHHQQQFSFLVDVLTLISKRKKPIVVVASKRDAVDEQCLSGVIQFLQKSADFRKIPIVEVSAHRNINVELAFLTLARLLDGTGNGNKSRCSKIKLLSYQDAIREQEEHQRRLREAFVNRVSLSPVGFLTDWQTFLSRYSHQSDVARFIDLWGSEVARETFEQFTAQWKNETKRRHLAKLPDALSTMLLYVGPVTNQPPGDILQRLRTHSQFEHFFISEKSSDDPINDSNFLQRHGVQKDESKIPFSLALKEPPDNGDSPFIESIKSLVCAEAWAANMSAFEDILLQRQFIGTKDFSLTILPGQSFNDYKLSLIDSGSDLSHEEKLEVYQKFQECIRLTAREEFLDLLLEHLPQFICVVSDYLTCLGDNYITTAASVLQTPPNRFPDMNRSRPASPVSEQTNVPIRSVQLPSADIRLCAGLAPPRGAKEQQLGLIRDRISCDRRYRAMDYMPSERQTLLASHFDILLPRSSKTEISPSQPQTSFHRHYSCSFVDQNNSFKLAFPLPHCPAYQTGRCMDLLFTNLCSDFGWGVRWEQGSFSSHLSCLLGQGGDKRLCVAVCAVCTDVTAASAAINLFRAAGFTPEGVTSPNQLTTCYYSGSTQTLVSSWPLASTLLTPADNVASLIGNPMISTVMGTVQATFLSHHEA